MRTKLLLSAFIIGMFIFSASAACAYNTVTIIFDGIDAVTDSWGQTTYNYEVTEFNADLLVGGAYNCQQITNAYYSAPGVRDYWRPLNGIMGNNAVSPFYRPELGPSSYPAAPPNWVYEEHLQTVMDPSPTPEWMKEMTTGFEIYLSDPSVVPPAPMASPDPPYVENGVFIVFSQQDSAQFGLNISSFKFYDRTGGPNAVLIPGTEYCVSETWVAADSRWGEPGEMDQIITVTFGEECPEVPIPPTALLLASGVIGLLWTRKRAGKR